MTHIHTNTPVGMVPDPKLHRFVYVFDKRNPYGGYTVVYAPELYNSEGYPTGDFAKVAIAYCRDTDRYSRKAGAAQALANLNSGQYVRLPIYRYGQPVNAIKHAMGVFMYGLFI